MTVEDLPPELRARLDHLFREDPVAAALGAELVAWDPGRAEVRATPGAQHCSFIGPVHGGVLFTLADVAFAVANNSRGRVGLGLSVDTRFLRAARAGQPLVAVAVERSRSRRIAAYDLEITQDDQLVASFGGLGYRTDRWHFGEEAWPASWRARG